MLHIRPTPFTFSALGALVLSLACRTTANPEAPGTRTEELETTCIQGRVDALAAAQIEGLRVSVYRLDEEGKLVDLALAARRTDAYGRYELRVALPAGASVNLIIVAETDEMPGRGMAMVPSWAVVDGVLIVPTIDLETAVETEVYLEAVKLGIWIPHLGTHELRKVISGRLARAIHESKDPDRDVAVIAQATVAAIDAWYRALLDPSSGLEPEQVVGVFEASAWAQVALDTQIFNARTQAQVASAQAAHARNVGAAYATLGVLPQHLAVAGQSAADALRAFAPRLTGPARMMLVSEAELLRARCVTSAIDSLLDRAGAPARSRDAVRAAGQRLSGRLVTAAETQDADTFVAAAWTEYEREVRGQLESVRHSAPPGEEPEADGAINPRRGGQVEQRRSRSRFRATLALEAASFPGALGRLV